MTERGWGFLEVMDCEGTSKMAYISGVSKRIKVDNGYYFFWIWDVMIDFSLCK